ncbi:MAG: C40 family peptidase [Candidatus Krumholzibacteriota bacterium]|nr:C40 family peptidase [Candidatus Krumholzibacteriota bacterium]
MMVFSLASISLDEPGKNRSMMNESIKYLLRLISLKEKELGLDWRSSWSRVALSPAGGVTARLSTIELARAVTASIEDLPAVEEAGFPLITRSADGMVIEISVPGSEDENILWATSSVVDLRRGPEHSAELITQAIMGETMIPLESRGDWYFVKLEDGYHGWVRSWSVASARRADIEKHVGSAGARVEINVGYLLSTVDPNSIPVTDLVSGTLVEILGTDGRFSLIGVPGGKTGYFPTDFLGPVVKGPPRRDAIIGRAEKFLGIPYIWGGTSAKGFDCSGLVKRVYLMEGMRLPRDADQQSAVGMIIPKADIDSALPADLLFFADGDKITHVAMAMGDGRFIHSFGDVRINSYRESDILYEEKLAKKLVFGRSVIS